MAFIKRKLLKDLEKHLSQKEISLIIGPRQVGKTTLMLLLEKKLKEKGERTLFLSLDNERDNRFFKSQDALIKKIELEIGKKRGFVFIDEIQRKENAGLFLKGIYDRNLSYKFIVSGSGSLELKEKIHESLVGRKRIFELLSVSFDEFVNFKTNYRYSQKLKDFFEIEREKSQELLEEYLNFGGYPRIILEEEREEKLKIIDEIFSSYLEKDISYLLGLKRPDVFSDLIRILAGQTGELINFSKIASSLNISLSTLKNYLWYAEKTFVIETIRPFFKNIKKEIVKSPVCYFYDLGLRNYALGSFGNIVDYGKVFENFIFCNLKDLLKFKGATIHFWRTKEMAEVDFVIKQGEKVLLIEAKYQKLKKLKTERSLRSFIEKYSPEKAIIVNLTLKAKTKIKKTEVIFLPFFDIFDLNFLP